MSQETTDFIPEQYYTEMEYEYAGMINTLSYLCKEAMSAKLELVSLHLTIAIEDLKEYRHPNQTVIKKSKISPDLK